MKRARISDWVRTRRYDEPSKDLVRSSLRQSCPDCIIATHGYSFREGPAEERGLIGSRHHVASLSEEMRRHIALYINLDMVGSPNFVRFVQGAAATGDGLAAVVRRELLAEFREHNLSVEERAEGRFGSDGAS